MPQTKSTSTICVIKKVNNVFNYIIQKFFTYYLFLYNIQHYFKKFNRRCLKILIFQPWFIFTMVFFFIHTMGDY